MAYFGRKPKKPGSVPGAASGGREQQRAGTLRSIGRELSRGRTARSARLVRTAVKARLPRSDRAHRKGN